MENKKRQSNTDKTQNVPQKKQKYEKKFQKSWLNEPQFQDWLKEDKNEKMAYCRACNASFLCGRSEIEKHMNGKKHSLKVRELQLPSVADIFKSNVNENESHNHNVKKAALCLSSFFAEHNIATLAVDHLTILLKRIFSDSKICRDLKLGRTKCMKIIQNNLAKVETNELVEILKTNNFSIMIDESTDISSAKNLCCVVKFINPFDNCLHTRLLDLIEIDARDSSAEVLYDAFKKSLETKGIPISNVKGFACDNASVMLGKNNSFFTRLLKDSPHIILLNCICHSSAIIANNACAELPKECEKLVQGAVNYITASPKNMSFLAEFQEYFNVEKKKLLHLCKTRWLIFHACVVRFLENWRVLEHMLLLDSVEYKKVKAKELYNYMTDKKIKAYLLFLKYVLNYFNKFNALFQNKGIMIHKLHSESKNIIMQIAQNFIKSEYISNIGENLFLQEQCLLSIEDIFTGPECEVYMKNLPVEECLRVKANCKKFYTTALKEILKRLPINDSFLKQIAFINPGIALESSNRNIEDEFDIIASKMQCSTGDLMVEWRHLPYCVPEEKKQHLVKLDVELFWKEIANLKNLDGTIMFPLLIRAAQFVFILPHSNADAERIFSMITDIKNKKRNLIGEQSLNSICIVRSSFSSKSINCTNFEPKADHFKLFSADIYK